VLPGGVDRARVPHQRRTAAAEKEEGGIGFPLLLMVFAVTQKSSSLSESKRLNGSKSRARAGAPPRF